MNKFVLGISPARGGSKGIPKKYNKDNNKTLIYYTINIAKSKYLDDYILNSDDKKIRQVARVLVLKLWIDQRNMHMIKSYK